MPVHSTERAAKLASSGLKPAVRRMSSVSSVAFARGLAVHLLGSQQQLRRGRMRAQHGEQGLKQPADLLRPRGGAVDGQVDLAPDLFGQPVEQLVLAAEVPVQRHRRHAELGRELADGQRVKPGLVGERERPVDHGSPGQAGPLALVGCAWKKSLDNYTAYKAGSAMTDLYNV